MVIFFIVYDTEYPSRVRVTTVSQPCPMSGETSRLPATHPEVTCCGHQYSSLPCTPVGCRRFSVPKDSPQCLRTQLVPAASLVIIITPLLGDRGFVADQDCRSISVSQDICPVVTSPYNNDGFVTAVLFFACWDKDIVKFNKVDCESTPNTVFDYHNGGRVT